MNLNFKSVFYKSVLSDDIWAKPYYSHKPMTSDESFLILKIANGIWPRVANTEMCGGFLGL